MKKIELTHAIIDDSGIVWIYINKEIVRLNRAYSYPCSSLDNGIAVLTQEGHIKPDPLQKALYELKNTNMAVYVDRKRAEKIIRTLWSER